MKLNKFIIFIGLISLSLLTTKVSGQIEINGNASTLFLKWQNSNCGINNDPSMVLAIQKQTRVFEDLFIRGFRQGPSKEYIDEKLNSEIARLRSNQTAINKRKIDTGLSQEDLEIAKKLDFENARKMISKDVIFGWKSRALTGLAYLNTKKAKDFLNIVSSNSKSEYQILTSYLIINIK